MNIEEKQTLFRQWMANVGYPNILAVARAAGISNTAIKNMLIARNQPSNYVITRLAVALDISPEQIREIFGESTRTPPPGAGSTAKHTGSMTPEEAFVAALLKRARINAENTLKPELAAEARFSLIAGGAHWFAEMAGIAPHVEQYVKTLPALPGTTSNRAVELARLADFPDRDATVA